MAKTKMQFGKIAVTLGFATQQQVDKALAIQQRLREQHKPHQLIGMIMLEHFMISNDQLIKILKYYEEHSRNSVAR